MTFDITFQYYIPITFEKYMRTNASEFFDFFRTAVL